MLSANGYWYATIDFEEANLDHADLSGSKVTTEKTGGVTSATIDFKKANLANADLSRSELKAEGMEATIDFRGPTLPTPT